MSPTVETNKPKLLIVDDEKTALQNLEYVMKKEGYDCICTQSALEALKLLERWQFDIVLTDLKMEKADGLDITKKCRSLQPNTEVIIITGFATLESAVNVMKEGAFYYVAKPFRLDEVRKIVREAVEKVRLKKENKR
ncbi:Fis family two component sigma-54 specific transcriptional regulator, partial [Candidatus Magnetoovum chiemensis]